MDRLDEVLRDVRRARKRLKPEQGRLARRNARRGFLGAIKALRNALNESYPYVERQKSEEEMERYVVEVFEPGPKRIGRRLYQNRWLPIRPKDLPKKLWSVSQDDVVPKRFLKMPRYKLKTAVKFVHWCKERFPDRNFRIRKVGSDASIPGII